MAWPGFDPTRFGIDRVGCIDRLSKELPWLGSPELRRLPELSDVMDELFKLRFILLTCKCDEKFFFNFGVLASFEP